MALLSFVLASRALAQQAGEPSDPAQVNEAKAQLRTALQGVLTRCDQSYFVSIATPDDRLCRTVMLEVEGVPEARIETPPISAQERRNGLEVTSEITIGGGRVRRQMCSRPEMELRRLPPTMWDQEHRGPPRASMEPVRGVSTEWTASVDRNFIRTYTVRRRFSIWSVRDTSPDQRMRLYGELQRTDINCRAFDQLPAAGSGIIGLDGPDTRALPNRREKAVEERGPGDVKAIEGSTVETAEEVNTAGSLERRTAAAQLLQRDPCKAAEQLAPDGNVDRLDRRSKDMHRMAQELCGASSRARP